MNTPDHILKIAEARLDAILNTSVEYGELKKLKARVEDDLMSFTDEVAGNAIVWAAAWLYEFGKLISGNELLEDAHDQYARFKREQHFIRIRKENTEKAAMAESKVLVGDNIEEMIIHKYIASYLQRELFAFKQIISTLQSRKKH